MAHWNIFDQACGHTYDSTRASLGFDPRYTPTNFNCFCSLEDGWGSFVQSGTDATLSSGTATLTCLWSSFKLQELRLNTTATQVSASIAGAAIAGVSISGGVVSLGSAAAPVVVKAGQALEIKLSGGVVALAVAASSAGCCGGSRCCGGGISIGGVAPSSSSLRKRGGNKGADAGYSCCDKKNERTAGAVRLDPTAAQIFSKILRDVLLFALVFCAGAMSVLIALRYEEEE